MAQAQSLALFFFVAAITPGPNNMMIMSSAINFGFRRSVPHFLGIVLGFPLMLGAIGLGAGKAFETFPWLQTALQAGCGAMILWMAWKIATAAPKGSQAGTDQKPMSFQQATLFQWVNPKAWFIGTAAISLFPPETSNLLPDLVSLMLAATMTGVFTAGIWMLMGLPLRQWLTKPMNLRIFNVTMASSLVGFYVYSSMSGA